MQLKSLIERTSLKMEELLEFNKRYYNQWKLGSSFLNEYFLVFFYDINPDVFGFWSDSSPFKKSELQQQRGEHTDVGSAIDTVFL